MLVHGIVASDRLPPEFFWGRIPETLRKAGYPVFFGGTDAVGTYQTNAAQLNATIVRVCGQTGAPRVLLLAHSKGGIDARYCLSAYDQGRRIAGLVTVDTPHRGSELADFIAERLPHPRAAKMLSRTLGRFFGDRAPAPLEAVLGLTTAQMTRFNNEVAEVAGVYYESCYTVLHGAWDDISLAASYRLLQAKAGPNDGVVSAASTRWGGRVRELSGLSGGISHWEIVDMKRRRVSGLDIPDLWVDMAARMAAEIEIKAEGRKELL